MLMKKLDKLMVMWYAEPKAKGTTQKWKVKNNK